MEWDVKIVFVPSSGNEETLLKNACAGGWEPYAVSASFHYFKRQKTADEIFMGRYSTIAQNAVVEDKQEVVVIAQVAHASFDTALKDDLNKKKEPVKKSKK